MADKEQSGSICSLDSKDESTGELKSRVFSFNNFAWSDTRTEDYKSDKGSWENIVRNTLIGNKGEHTAFNVRYFEVGEGGYSSLERHKHEHVVIVLRGRGTVRIGESELPLKPFDVVYIKPNEVHQLKNPYNEQFGFLCIVDAIRDVSVLVGK